MAGWLTGCCLTDCFTLWTDSQRGRVTEPVETGFSPPLPPPGRLIIARSQLRLACCAVLYIKKTGIKIRSY